MANNTDYNNDLNTTLTTKEEEPATKHDVSEGGIIGAVGGAVVGGLAGGPVGAVIGAIVGGAASAGAVNIVDKHDNDYDRSGTGSGYTATNTVDADDTLRDPSYDATTTGTTANTATYAGSGTATDYGTASYGAGTDTTADNRYTGVQDSSDQVVIPIVEEDISVGKRQVQGGGASIHTGVVETPVNQDVTLREEHVTVDRRPVDRAATDADLAFKGGSFDVIETDEEAVVAKNARVVEEVVVGKTATERTETIHDTVRRTEVDVEDLSTDNTTRPNSRL